MRRFALPLALLAAVIVALAAAWMVVGGAGGRGGERVSTDVPAVGPFSRVSLTGYAELVLVQGEREAVTVEASPRLASRIRVRSSEGRLSIDAVDGRPWWSVLGGGGVRPPTVTVHFRTLDALDVSGAVKVNAASIDTPKLSVTAAGAASLSIDALRAQSLDFDGAGAVKAELAGTLADQSVSIAGAGDYRASKLASQSARIDVSGAGRAVVNVEKRLEADISGAGSIEYFGDPVVRERISGAGRIQRRSAGAPSPARLRVAAPCQWTVTGDPGGTVSGLNSSGPPVTASRSGCTPETARISATRQSWSRSTSVAATSPTRSQG